jgi:hypothetical protein
MRCSFMLWNLYLKVFIKIQCDNSVENATFGDASQGVLTKLEAEKYYVLLKVGNIELFKIFMNLN